MLKLVEYLDFFGKNKTILYVEKYGSPGEKKTK